MRKVGFSSLLPLLALVTPAVVHAEGGDDRVRAYIAKYTERNPAAAHAAIPPWARRYNVNCSHCHEPVVPRLNATGMRFRWAGYRMPEDIGQEAKVSQIGNYLGLRGLFRYVYTKPENAPATQSEFTIADVNVFYAGPFGKNFGGWFELAGGTGESISAEQIFGIGVWGKETSFGGLRIGRMHGLLNNGLAGFDRVVGITRPSPVGNPITSSIPFAFAGEQSGIEAFYAVKSNRISGQLFNGDLRGEEGVEDIGSKRKNAGIADQFIIDERGSAINALAFYGTVTGLDSLEPDLNSHFWRLGLTANKIFGSDSTNFEVLGGVTYGKDLDLPASFGTNQRKGYGFWGSGQYLLAHPAVTFFARYEFVDPDKDIPSNGTNRYLAGFVFPVNIPEYGRLAFEYFLDDPQGTGAKRHNLRAEMMVSF